MPRAIVKQPDGRYAIWSSIVDDFTVVGATAEEAINDELTNPIYATYPGGYDELRKDICREFENIHRTGRAWKWAPTWQEAIQIIRELHGNDAARSRLLDAIASTRGDDDAD